MKRAVMILMSLILIFSLAGCGEVSKAEKLISEIGVVSLESDAAIQTAKAAYDALSDKDKAKVKNYTVLQEAQTQYETAVKANYYADAESAFQSGDYTRALDLFTCADDYQDAKDKSVLAEKAVHYQKGDTAFADEDFATALSEYTQAGNYEDAAAKVGVSEQAIHYLNAETALANDDLELAVAEFTSAAGYRDAAARVLEAKTALKHQRYGHIYDIITGNTYCYAPESINAVSGFHLLDDTNAEYLDTFWIDGVRHESDPVKGTYEVTDTSIIISCGKDCSLTIPYAMTDDRLSLGDGRTYFDLDSVAESIQGYWRCADYSTKKKVTAYNLKFDGDKVSYECAWLAGAGDSGYYYQEPSEGTISEIQFAKFDTDVWAGGIIGFMIVDGEVRPTIRGQACKRSDADKFPGFEGYDRVFYTVSGYQLALGY